MCQKDADSMELRDLVMEEIPNKDVFWNPGK